MTKYPKTAMIALAVGVGILAGAYMLAGCGSPKAFVTSKLHSEDNSGNAYYYVYATEVEDGEAIIKCYEVTKDKFENLEVGDDFTP